MAPKGSLRPHPARAKSRRRVPAPVVPGSVPEGVALSSPPPETPHGHLICHRCGRMAELELTELDRHLLMELSRRRPKGWEVDGVTFSLTGTCPRCSAEAR
jgi:Fe2+ or Zn2+ uptake regulation protein